MSHSASEMTDSLPAAVVVHNDSSQTTDPESSPTTAQDSEQPVLKPDALVAGISIMLMLTVSQRAVGFIRQVLVCRQLDPDELGRWNLSFSMIVLLAPLLVLGLPGTFNRYAEYFRHRGQVRRFFRKTILATMALTAVGCVAMASATDTTAWLIYSDASQVSLVLLLVPTIIAVIAFNTLTEMMSSLRQVRLVAWMRFGHAILFSLSALVAVVMFRGGTSSLIVSYAVASLLVCVIAALPIARAWRGMSDQASSASQPLWAKLLPFAGWIWLSDLLSNLYAAADRYMIIHLAQSSAEHAAAVIGQYHSSRIVPQLFVAVAVLIGAAILPYLSHDWESGNRQRVSDRLQTALKGFAIATTCGGLLLIKISPWLFGEIMGGKYAAGLAVLPMTLFYCTLYGLFCIGQDYLFCCEKGGHISIALGLGLILNVVLNFMLVPRWELVGGVSATVLANVISLAALYWLMARQGMRWQRGTWLATAFPLCFFLPATTGMLVTAAVMVLGIRWRVLLSDDELVATCEALNRGSQKILRRNLFWFDGATISD